MHAYSTHPGGPALLQQELQVLTAPTVGLFGEAERRQHPGIVQLLELIAEPLEVARVDLLHYSARPVVVVAAVVVPAITEDVDRLDRTPRCADDVQHTVEVPGKRLLAANEGAGRAVGARYAEVAPGVAVQHVVRLAFAVQPRVVQRRHVAGAVGSEPPSLKILAALYGEQLLDEFDALRKGVVTGVLVARRSPMETEEAK